MYDQADPLRQLVRQVASQPSAAEQRAGVVLLTSGKGGVGTTTVAVNLAVAIAQSGLRVVLIDADPNGGNVATQCSLNDRYTLADVLAERRTLRKILQPGPGGIEVAAGLWPLERFSDYKATAAEHLITEVLGLADRADVVLVDAGSTANKVAHCFWEIADAVLAVATPDNAAILDTYAAIKLGATAAAGKPIHAMLNQTSGNEQAEEILQRFDQACQRFLGIELIQAGSLPADASVASASEAGLPVVLAAPESAVAKSLSRVARHVIEKMVVLTEDPSDSALSRLLA